MKKGGVRAILVKTGDFVDIFCVVAWSPRVQIPGFPGRLGRARWRRKRTKNVLHVFRKVIVLYGFV